MNPVYVLHTWCLIVFFLRMNKVATWCGQTRVVVYLTYLYTISNVIQLKTGGRQYAALDRSAGSIKVRCVTELSRRNIV